MLPAAHFVHTEAAAAEYMPAAHVSHAVLAVTPWYLPAAHESQLTEAEDPL